MKTILHLHAKAKDIVAQNIPLSKILNLGLFDKLTKMKYDILTASLKCLMITLRKLTKSLLQFLNKEGTQ